MLYQILALLIWGSSFIAAKYSYEMLDPTLMVEARLLIAALMVLPSCRRHLGRIPRSEWKPLLWISFVNYVVVLMLQFIGLKYTSAASAGGLCRSFLLQRQSQTLPLDLLRGGVCRRGHDGNGRCRRGRYD